MRLYVWARRKLSIRLLIPKNCICLLVSSASKLTKLKHYPFSPHASRQLWLCSTVRRFYHRLSSNEIRTKMAFALCFSFEFSNSWVKAVKRFSLEAPHIIIHQSSSHGYYASQTLLKIWYRHDVVGQDPSPTYSIAIILQLRQGMLRAWIIYTLLASLFFLRTPKTPF